MTSGDIYWNTLR